jgi:CRISPR-associated protein Cas2
MQCLLIYDIANDGARIKVADVCLDYGLERIQYSAFAGSLSKTHQRELLVRIRQCLSKGRACIHLFPLDEKCWASHREIKQGADDNG